MGEIVRGPNGELMMLRDLGAPKRQQRPQRPEQYARRAGGPRPAARRGSPADTLARHDAAKAASEAESLRRLRNAQAARRERGNWVKLDEVARSLGVHANALASALTGRVEMRVEDDHLDLATAGLQEAIERIDVKRLPGPKRSDETPESSRYGIVTSNRKPRRRLGSPERVPSLRPWSRD